MTDLPKITPVENGPLIVENPPRLTGPDGAEIETRPKFGLFRCGHSKNKPSCDGSRQDAKWSDDDNNSAAD